MPAKLTIHELDPALRVNHALAHFANERFLILLNSAAHIRDRDARYSILTADPVATERLDVAEYDSDPFGILRTWQRQLCGVLTDMPFCGGIAGMMSYELGSAFEIVPRPSGDEFHIPVLVAGLFDWAIVWDHLSHWVRLCVLEFHEPTIEFKKRTSQDRRVWVEQKLAVDLPTQNAMPVTGELSGYQLPMAPNVYSGFSRANYVDSVQRVIEYIQAGDIFQVNLSQQLTAHWPHSAIELYHRVQTHNPAPFCGLLQCEDFAVVSASPERFLKVSGGNNVETRPIKGTRRRQQSPIADLFTSDELVTSEKDRAENVMIVDLLRNDLSRVCQAGSVKVTGLCEIEVFETVQHLVSTIVGKLNASADVWDLCAASMPGGSITGAPKIRAMEIIAELEPAVRGAYCGHLFYLGPNGDFDSSILIRTFTLKNGVVQFPVGGGIVADSNPEDEYQETLHKAAGMFNTLNTVNEIG